MKLNPDCVRDILLVVEQCSFGQGLTLDSLHAQLPDYSEEDIWYTILKLDEAGFLNVTTVSILRMTMPGIKAVNDITYAGHEFLNSVRENRNWKTVKEVAAKAGSFSIHSLGVIAQSVVSTAINAALKLNQ